MAKRHPRQPLLTAPQSPSDYTLEKWIAVLLALLFLVPLIASGAEPEAPPAYEQARLAAALARELAA